MKKIAWLTLLCVVVCSFGCATTRSQSGPNMKPVMDGLEATYWGVYSAGKALEIPKLATGGPAPNMVFETGVKALFIPLGIMIKMSKQGEKTKQQEKISVNDIEER